MSQVLDLLKNLRACELIAGIALLAALALAWFLRGMWAANGRWRLPASFGVLLAGAAALGFGAASLNLVGLVIAAVIVVAVTAMVLRGTDRFEYGRVGAVLGGSLVLVVALVLGDLAWHQLGGQGNLLPHPIKLESGMYVALGDSYSAGEGNPPFVNQDCHRSRINSYPAQLEFDPPRTALSVACSGDIIDDVAMFPAGSQPRSNRPFQIDAVDAATNLKLVTITISGNDANFSKVLTFCAGTDHCMSKPYQGKGSLREWADAHVTISQKLARLFPALHTAARKARVVVLGYPQLFPDGGGHSGPICGAVAYFRHIDSPEREDIRKLESRLNATINAAATAAGLEFVSTEQIFDGHEACTSHEWLRPVTAGSGAFHPNAAGQKRLARIVECQLDRSSDGASIDRVSTLIGTLTEDRATSSAGTDSDAALQACALGK